MDEPSKEIMKRAAHEMGMHYLDLEHLFDITRKYMQSESGSLTEALAEHMLIENVKQIIRRGPDKSMRFILLTISVFGEMVSDSQFMSKIEKHKENNLAFLNEIEED